LKIILINKANNKKTKQINQHKNDDFNRSHIQYKY